MRLREWLVVSQVALAFVLLVGAGLLIASFQAIRRIDLGVKPQGILVFELHLPDARYDSTARAHFYEQVAKRMEAIPGVRAAGGVSKLPATGPYNQWGTAPMSGPLANSKQGRDGGAEQRVVSGDYFRVVGIPLLEGRLFDSRDDASAPARVVVSKSLAQRLFPGVPAVGQRLRAGGRTKEIIGVVGDVAINAEGQPDRYVYHAHAQFAGDRNWALTQVVQTTASLDFVREEATRALASLDPQLVMYKPTNLEEAIGQSEAQRAFTLRILGSFAVVALALSALGLFGVLSYGVRLRSREFGIRMALGAEAGAIRRMVLRQGLTVTAIGTAIGFVGALLLSRLMASMVFQVSPLDPRVLTGAVIFMGLIGAIAAYLPAHRATMADPRTTLQ
jgi:predicted permease